jgi:hypothetical protein
MEWQDMSECALHFMQVEDFQYQSVVKSICENYTYEVGGAVVIIENRFYQRFV